MSHVSPSSLRAGVIVISAWVENDELGALRARFTATNDIKAVGCSDSWVVVGVDAACDSLRRWLASVVAAQEQV